MKGPRDIIQAPLISEKGTRIGRERQSGSCSRFGRKPTRSRSSKPSRRLFKVKVVEVRMARYLGKVRRIGRSMGRRSDWKKAYVTLKEGDKIDFFGGA